MSKELEVINKIEVVTDERFKIFDKENLGKVRTVFNNNEIWFCIKDICDVLEIKNPSDIPKRLDEDEVHRFNLGGQVGIVNFTNESGLFTLILRSDKPQAKPFRKWVTSEILPAVRKTGTYTDTTRIKEPTEVQKKRLEIMDRNSRARMSKEFSKLATQIDNPKFKEILNVYAANTLADNEILPLPRLEQKTYTATELGNILGISGNMVGRIANEYNLKNDENGYWAYDKAKGHSKQVESFRYFEHSIEKFKEILKNRIA